MRSEWVRAERDSEVRETAQSWREANAIDAQTLSAIETLYPTAWRKPAMLWSVLVFFFVSLFAIGLIFSLRVLGKELTATPFLLAGGLAFAADRLRRSASTVGAAAAPAAAFWSVICLLIGTAEMTKGTHILTALLAIGVVAWAAGAWRWGYPAFAAFAAAFFFLLLARFPPGRVLWLVLGGALAAACASLLDRRALAPSHRRGAAAVLITSLGAIYAAINLYALDHHFVESISETAWRPPGGPAGTTRVLAAIATAVFPLLVLGWGIRQRRDLLVDAGIVSAALSLVTLRYYLHIAPLWTVLTVAGCATIFISLGIHRWLSRAPGRQRGGFTAEPLYEDETKQQMLGALGAVSLTPEARTASPQAGTFSGGGGSFGGGGTSGTF